MIFVITILTQSLHAYFLYVRVTIQYRQNSS